jgi:hypothetical protein
MQEGGVKAEQGSGGSPPRLRLSWKTKVGRYLGLDPSRWAA